VRAPPSAFVEKRSDNPGQCLDGRLDLRFEGCRAAEPGQIDGDDLLCSRQGIQYGAPHLPMAAEAVQQQQRLARSFPLVGE
jgi:hypothetical protein